VNQAFFAELSAWLMQAGLAGTSGLCDRLDSCWLVRRCSLTRFILSTRAVYFAGALVQPNRLCSKYGRTSQDGLAATGFDPKDVDRSTSSIRARRSHS